MYKCKLFESLYRLIPKYIKILCPTAYVNNIDQIPTAPISPPVRRTITQNEASNITEDEDNEIVQLVRPIKAARFNGAKRECDRLRNSRVDKTSCMSQALE